MTVKKFELQKSYEVIEIDGKEYRMELNDDALKNYRETYQTLSKKVKENKETDFSTMSEDEAAAFEDEQKKIMETLFNMMLGDGSYGALYEASGRSTYGLAHLAIELMSVVNEKYSAIEDKKVDYYKPKRKAK